MVATLWPVVVRLLEFHMVYNGNFVQWLCLHRERAMGDEMSGFEWISDNLESPIKCIELRNAHSIKCKKNLELLWQIRTVTAFHKWKDGIGIGIGWNRARPAAFCFGSHFGNSTDQTSAPLLVCGLWWTDRERRRLPKWNGSKGVAPVLYGTSH